MSELPVIVRYTNWRGETATRRIILGRVRFGATEWHQKPTWLINAFDIDHPAQIWKEFDLTKCDFTAEPSEAEILAHPKVRGLVEALREYVYETTHLSPEQRDGSHWCKISKECSTRARAALAAMREVKDA